MIEPIADGVYFNLANETYQADTALGSHDHKALLFSPVRWWWKSAWAAMLREALMSSAALEEESLAQAFGSAVHVMSLEGRATFDKRYWLRPEAPEGVLATRDDMRAALLDVTGRRPFGQLSHADLVLECRKVGPAVGLLLEDWEAGLLEDRAGRIEISRRWEAIMRLIDHMLDQPRPDYGGKSQREHVLRGGFAEVSVFWTVDGVRYKARFDYLRLKAIVDLKTYSAKDDEESVAAFVRSAEQYAYDLQTAHYLDAWTQLGPLIRAGRVDLGDGPAPDQAWLDKLAARDQLPAWTWLAVQTVGMPETDVLEFPAGTLAASGNYQMLEARRKFVEFRDRFGMDTPWVSTRGTIKLTDEVFEAMGRIRRMASRGEEHYDARPA